LRHELSHGTHAEDQQEAPNLRRTRVYRDSMEKWWHRSGGLICVDNSLLGWNVNPSYGCDGFRRYGNGRRGRADGSIGLFWHWMHTIEGLMNKKGMAIRILDLVNVLLLVSSEALICLIQTRQTAYSVGTLAFWFFPSLIIIPWSTSALLSRELYKQAKVPEDSQLLRSSLWRISLLSLVTTAAIFVCLTSFLTVSGIPRPK